MDSEMKRRIAQCECDFHKCNYDTISLALASLIYRRDDAYEVIKAIFPRMNLKIYDRLHSAQLFAIAVCDVDNVLWNINRGTGGKDLIGRTLSWLYDAFILKTKYGTHSGFSKMSEYAMKFLKPMLKDYAKLKCVGTSQGAAVSVLVAAEAAGNIAVSDFTGFAPVPAGDAKHAAMINYLISLGLMSGKLFINPDDPAASTSLRNANSKLLNGAYAGEIITLEDINKHDVGISRLNNHSPAQYVASYALWRCKMNQGESMSATVSRDLKLLSLLPDLLIN